MSPLMTLALPPAALIAIVAHRHYSRWRLERRFTLLLAAIGRE